jgi:hypothetical protein
MKATLYLAVQIAVESRRVNPKRGKTKEVAVITKLACSARVFHFKGFQVMGDRTLFLFFCFSWAGSR